MRNVIHILSQLLFKLLCGFPRMILLVVAKIKYLLMWVLKDLFQLNLIPIFHNTFLHIGRNNSYGRDALNSPNTTIQNG
jgi:hypothetical protein